jgi:transposase-like protein
MWQVALPEKPEELTGLNGLLKQLTGPLVERALGTGRKVVRVRGHFPNDEAAVKLLYLAIRNVEKRWTRQPQYWNRALNQIAVMFEGRLPA